MCRRVQRGRNKTDQLAD